MQTTNEKMVGVPERVEDLCGLYLELRKADFSVKNVGGDVRGTYVYLDPKEEKDPSEIIRSWVGRRPPKPGDRSRFRAMKEDAEAQASAASAEPPPQDPVPASEATEEKPPEASGEKPVGWWGKFWRKLF